MEQPRESEFNLAIATLQQERYLLNVCIEKKAVGDYYGWCLALDSLYSEIAAQMDKEESIVIEKRMNNAIQLSLKIRHNTTSAQLDEFRLMAMLNKIERELRRVLLKLGHTMKFKDDGSEAMGRM